MTRAGSTIMLCAVLMGGSVQARTLAGVEMPDSVVVDGETLRLNGMGLRQATMLRVKAYVGGLYLAQPTKDAAMVIDSSQRKRVTMKFLRNIDHKSLTGGWAESLKKAGAKSADIDAFSALVPDVKAGDMLSFTWRPGTGLEVADGTVRGSVPGDDFARALFKVWFGPEPGDENLKRGMLGH